jgi:hypothetical protein
MTVLPGFKNYKVLVLFLVYLLVNFFLLYRFGVQVNGEAVKYIDDANRILNGQPLRNGIFSISYIGYSFLVLVFIKCGISFFFMGIFQGILSFFAASCLYKVCYCIGVKKNVAFIFFIVYLLCLPIQKWIFFLYTESVHTSILVIAFYYIYRFFNTTFKNWLIIFLLIIAVIFTRPVGIVFIVALFMVILYWCFKKGYKIYTLISVCVIIGTVILFIFSPYATYINPDSLKRMEIICQVPQANNNIVYHEINNAGLYEAFRVIKNEIGVKAFFINGCKKLISFYGLYRPYYSSLNNGILICYTLLYPLAIAGLFVKVPQQVKYVKLFSIIYVLFTSVLIFFTCDDWSNRFISPVFPFILFLATSGLNNIFKKLNVTT